MANASIRYGATLRKRQREVKEEKRASYMCDICGKVAVRRIGTGIWKCRHCNTVYAGGAYTMKTAAGEAAKKLIEGIQGNSGA
ncbi:MAG: 50S ribosomal protein L37ae [Candidatus Marsarchaeota archaeon]|jgi:large subunit ribosomal protein L37Ae|nr:50S ribosomal protein L37ae [Candidatus Marsarchaeota archaeon]MCL5418676.1 50S ribosomal protein L37ae [Candidatus Marsarchaeota archaeon]